MMTKVFFSAAGILEGVLVAVAVVDQPRALAQTQPEAPAAGEAEDDDAGAAQNPGKGAGGFMVGMGVAGSPQGMGGFGGMGGGMGGGVAAQSPAKGSGGFMGGMGTAGSPEGMGGMGGMGGGMAAQGPRRMFMRFAQGSAPSSPRQKLEARLAPLLRKLRQAEDDKQKKAISGEVSSILSDEFDKDMERRLSEITSLEQRVKRLRDQCEQRQQAKEEIVRLQLKVLENEAAGLGFFGPGSPSVAVEAAAGRQASAP